uniref:Putative secreted protein n=1 Tax=Rhipicephalus microplus TaxID=6941 RepID=A0A6M2DD44_RHIMP
MHLHFLMILFRKVGAFFLFCSLSWAPLKIKSFIIVGFAGGEQQKMVEMTGSGVVSRQTAATKLHFKGAPQHFFFVLSENAANQWSRESNIIEQNIIVQ